MTTIKKGATSGLAYQTWKNNQKLAVYAGHYDGIYNFQSLMIDGNVLPPVLTHVRDVYDQQSDSILRLVDSAYRIESQAKFVSQAPTWRSYVIRDYSASPTPTLHFVSGDEEALFRASVADGWREGITQAGNIMREGLNRLKRDFEGMVLYRELLAKKRVTKPFVAQSAQAITGNPGTHINLSETLLRITALPAMVVNSEVWMHE